MMERIKIATRSDWNNSPMPGENIPFFLNKHLTNKEFDCLRYGMIPSCMEEKWFVFLEEQTIFFHRSWTGNCIFTAHFQNTETGYVIDECVASRNPEQYMETSIEKDKELLDRLVEMVIGVNRSALYPSPEQVEFEQLNKAMRQYETSFGMTFNKKADWDSLDSKNQEGIALCMLYQSNGVAVPYCNHGTWFYKHMLRGLNTIGYRELAEKYRKLYNEHFSRYALLLRLSLIRRRLPLYYVSKADEWLLRKMLKNKDTLFQLGEFEQRMEFLERLHQTYYPEIQDSVS